MSAYPPSNPVFEHLARLQNSIGNITTYANGDLRIVEYPANDDGEPVSPEHVWMMCITHDLPCLFCFHGREAWVRMPGVFTHGTVLCRSEEDSCGYAIDFFRIARHHHLRTKVYNYRESAVEVAVQTTPSRLRDEEDMEIDFSRTEYSPSPSTAATRSSTPSLEIGPRDIPSTPPPAYSTASTRPEATRHANTPPQVQEESDRDVQEVLVALQNRGVTKERFWQTFRRCSFCKFIIKKSDQHRCLAIIDLTGNDDEETRAIIDLTGDDDEETRVFIDLTGDDD